MKVRCLWLVMLAVIVASCTSGPGPVDETPYLEKVKTTRAEKDEFLRSAKDSPLLPEQRPTFPGLAYYDINPDYRLPAFLTERKGEAPVIIELQRTDNQTDKMRKVGGLGFAIGAQQYTLTAFADVNDQTMERLFVPFGDLTNGTETYGGGRYMNLSRTQTGLYEVDFNQAYHPYCVYNPAWACPVPPRENRLAVAIPAGERFGGAFKAK